MANVLLRGWEWRSPWAGHGTFSILCLLALSSWTEARAQTAEGKTAKTDAAKSKPSTATAPAGRPKAEGEKAAVAPDVGGAAPAAGESSQVRKIDPNEVFRDPKAEALADISKLRPANLRPVTVSPNEIADFEAQAGGANANLDKDLISRVVDFQVGRLTDRASVQALIEPPDPSPTPKPPNRNVQDATMGLLKPIFQARNAKNQAFLTIYYRLLKEKLTPLLRNHLIPRVQAMIILGQAGVADYLPLYLAQIRDPNQTLWVKLWAMEGIVNVVEEGNRLSANDQITAAKTVSEFLNQSDLPWPIQLRALEVLTAMRQGAEASAAKKAFMANAAMAVLTDASARPEVRAEAARALGFMQISSSVTNYNFPLVAHATGQLAAELATRIATVYSTNEDKAKYLTALLIGPVYQAFDGAQPVRDSGLIHSASGASTTYVQKVFDLAKPVVRSTIDLLSSGQRQSKERQKEVLAQVAALREFLDKNPPAHRYLVPGEAEFPIALLPDAGLKPAANPEPGRGRN